jgi:hypothetical protein
MPPFEDKAYGHPHRASSSVERRRQRSSYSSGAGTHPCSCLSQATLDKPLRPTSERLCCSFLCILIALSVGPRERERWTGGGLRLRKVSEPYHPASLGRS